MKIYIGLFLTLLVGRQLHAQSDSGGITLLVDSRADALALKQAQINRTSMYKNSAGQWKGYRVMVLNTNNRELANKTKADILRLYPNVAVYLSYQAPYFKLKAGDFLKRPDAEKFRKELAGRLNQNLFVISDIIKISAEDEHKILNESGSEKWQ